MKKQVNGHFPNQNRLKVYYQGEVWEIHAFNEKAFYLSQRTHPESDIYIFNGNRAFRAKLKDLRIASNVEIYKNRFDKK